MAGTNSRGRLSRRRRHRIEAKAPAAAAIPVSAQELLDTSMDLDFCVGGKHTRLGKETTSPDSLSSKNSPLQKKQSTESPHREPIRAPRHEQLKLHAICIDGRIVRGGDEDAYKKSISRRNQFLVNLSKRGATPDTLCFSRLSKDASKEASVDSWEPSRHEVVTSSTFEKIPIVPVDTLSPISLWNHISDLDFKSLNITVIAGATPAPPIESHEQVEMAKPFWLRVSELGRNGHIGTLQVVFVHPDDHASKTEMFSSWASTWESIFRKFAEDKFQNDWSSLQFGETEVHPFDIRISSMNDSPIDYHGLAVQLVGDLMEPRSRKLSVHLPFCDDSEEESPRQIALDATYRHVPFRLDSPLAHALLEDLDILSKTQLRAIQRVPMASVDASLLYGVPLRVVPGVEEDYSIQQQTNGLALALFHALAEGDSGLVLQAGISSVDDRLLESSLFHTRGEFFLLVPDQPPGFSSMEGVFIQQGSIFRLASAESFVNIEESASMMASMDVGPETHRLYVEDSLESLPCSAFNPWQAAVRPSQR
eukprot:Nitzschia sp. Nitz4//scaffold13_size275219//66181//67875//NITZ4_000855-RA/size275219-snap-gene-0.4-mRNA-1//1//CDS//3329535957//5169//frame0